MMTVPMKDKLGHSYLALDRGAGILRNTTWVEDPNSGEWERSSLFDLFVRELDRVKPAGTLGIIASDSTSGDASEVRDTMLHSPFYSKGIRIGGKGDLLHPDPSFIRALHAVSPTHSYASAYGGNGVFDIVNPSTTEVKVLTEKPMEVMRYLLSTKSSEDKKAVIRTGTWAMRVYRAAHPTFLFSMGALMDDPNTEVRDLARLAVMEALARDRRQNFIPSEILETLADGARVLPTSAEAYQQNDSRAVRAAAADLLAGEKREFAPTCGERLSALKGEAKKYWAKERSALLVAGSILSMASGLTMFVHGTKNDWRYFPGFLQPDRSSKDGFFLRSKQVDYRPESLDWRAELIESRMKQAKAFRGNGASEPDQKALDAAFERIDGVPARLRELKASYPGKGWSNGESREVKRLLQRADEFLSVVGNTVP